MNDPYDNDELVVDIAAAIHDQAMAIVRFNRSLEEAGAIACPEWWSDFDRYTAAREEASQITAGMLAGGML